MALPLILRNSARFQASPFLKSSAFINSKRCFSQFSLQSSKNVVAYEKNKMNIVVLKRNMSADHSKLWPIEKAVSIALLGIVPATFLTPNLILDDIFATIVVVHMHWGLEAVVVDYVRPILFGAAIPKLALGLLYLLSASTLGGLLYYNHNCSGIGCTFRQFWEIKK